MQAERSKVDNGYSCKYKYKHQFIEKHVDYKDGTVYLIIDRPNKILYYNKICYAGANLVILI